MSTQYYTTQEQAYIPGREIRALRQWLGWRAVRKPNGKINKPPIDANTGKAGSSTNPATWSDYDLAASRSPEGMPAFVLTADDPYFAGDLDNCVNPETGEIAPWAQAIVDRIPTYWEISYSGTGLRCIGRGVIPGDRCRTGDIEVYDSGRYVVMTWRTLPGCETIRNCQAELTRWHREVFPADSARSEPQPATAPGDSPTGDDADLLERIRRSRNGPAFVALYDRGDTSGHGDDHSAADLALMNLLRYWTAADPDRMERLFTASALGQREKWRSRADYRRRTIERALPGDTWTPSQPPSSQPAGPIRHHAFDGGERAQDGDTCPAQLAAAHRRIAELEADNQRLTEANARAWERTREAEARADRLAVTRSAEMHILRNDDLPTGERLTGFALAVDLGARIANGETPTANGYAAPAARIAEMTGQSEQAVQRHMRTLTKRKAIRKRLVRTPEAVNGETGEITGARDMNFIEVPGENVIDFVSRLASYRRQDAEPDTPKPHGGIRPTCPDHPHAGTIRRWETICAECETVLEAGETHQPPAGSSPINLIPETGVASSVLSDTKLIAEAGEPSRTKMTGEPRTIRPTFGSDISGQAGDDKWTWAGSGGAT